MTPGKLTACIACWLTLCLADATACSCVNSTPLQGKLYAESAVFTARIIHLMGSPFRQEGRLVSTMAVAVVRQRYWGLPWYWPGLVVLDGGSMCPQTLSEGEYVVQAWRIRFGVLDVSHCTRTRPVEEAAIDFRTLDGSRCAGPGGTVAGRVLEAGVGADRPAPAAGITVTFRDSQGAAYPAVSDAEGFFEVRHLAPGFYSLDSPSADGRGLVGGVTVRSSGCVESTVWLNARAATRPGDRGSRR